MAEAAEEVEAAVVGEAEAEGVEVANRAQCRYGRSTQFLSFPYLSVFNEKIRSWFRWQPSGHAA